jgi:carbon monoxide dehydrogenase subunit G
MTVTKSWHVDAPVETVFEYFKDPEFGAELTPMDIHDVKMTKDGVGTNYGWDLKMGPLRVGGFEVLTDVVPNKQITERSSWSMFGKWVYTFEPEGKGTKLTIKVEPQSFWSIPPLDRVVGLGIDRMSRTMMPRLIKEIEKEAKQEKAARKSPRKPAATT